MVNARMWKVQFWLDGMWCDCSATLSRDEAEDELHEYKENSPGTRFRIVEDDTPDDE